MRYLLVALAVAFTGVALVRGADTAKPNILFILTDDQGWPTLGCYGNQRAPTPHLDRLAAEGVRFTAAYATPQCTPTRAALLTGQHPARTRMWHVIPWYAYPWAPVGEPPFAENLPRETFTLAKGLQAAGYATAMVGKWHLTANADGNYERLLPESARFYGFDYAAPLGPGSLHEGDKHVTHLTDEAIRFIDRHRDRPWFCYLSHHTLHGVVSAPAELVAKYREQGAPAAGLHNATYLAAIEHLDASIGRLLASLEERKLRNRTLVVFLSDNGGVSRGYDTEPFTKGAGKLAALKVAEQQFDNAPLRTGKGTLYEGGIRVPCLVRWPGKANPGLVCDAPVQATDWLPTLLAAAGTQAPERHPLDGRSLVPLLEGKPWSTRSLYWHAPLYDLRWGATPAAAVRQDHYKLIEFFGDSFDDTGQYRPGHRLELYDLKADPGETTDLSRRLPERAKGLQDDLRQFLRSVAAEVPGSNPHFDQSRLFRQTRDRADRPKP